MAFEPSTMLGALLGFQKEEETIEKVKAETQMTAKHGALYEAQTKTLEENAEVDRRTRDANKKAQALIDAAREKRDPNISVASTMATQGGPDPLATAIADSARTAQEQRAIAAQIRSYGGDEKAAQKAEQVAIQADQTLYHNQNLMFDKQRNLAKEVASAAGSLLPDGSNAPQIGARLTALNPNWMKQAGDAIDVSLNGDTLLPGKRTQAYLASMQRQGISAEKQVDDDQKMLELKHKKDVLAQAAIDEKGRENRHAAAQQLSREGHDIQRDAERGRNYRHDTPSAATRSREKEASVPTKNEVESTAALFGTKFAIPPDQAEAAAYDYHRKVNELVFKNKANPEYTRATAEMEALDFVDGKVKKSEKATGWSSLFKSDTPAEYERWKKDDGAGKNSAPEVINQQNAQDLAKVGVGFRLSGDGAITLSPLSNTPPAKAAIITKAQEALNSGKYDKAKVLEILKQQMVAK